jgi:hypothetical protein
MVKKSASATSKLPVALRSPTCGMGYDVPAQAFSHLDGRADRPEVRPLEAEVSPVQQRRVREAKARLRDEEDRAPAAAAPAALPAGTIRT